MEESTHIFSRWEYRRRPWGHMLPILICTHPMFLRSLLSQEMMYSLILGGKRALPVLPPRLFLPVGNDLCNPQWLIRFVIYVFISVLTQAIVWRFFFLCHCLCSFSVVLYGSLRLFDAERNVLCVYRCVHGRGGSMLLLSRCTKLFLVLRKGVSNKTISYN